MIAALRRHATTIALSILALGGVVAVFADRGSVTTTESEERKKNLFAAFRTDEISELTVTAQGKTARLTRGALDDAGQQRWQVELDGARYPADEQAVDRYLGALELGTAERWVPAASVDRAGFGLTLPRIEVRAVMGSQKLHLALGGPAPMPAGGVYAEIEGRGVGVVTRELGASLDIHVEELRSRAFIPYGIDETASLAIIDRDGGVRRLTRPGEIRLGRGAGFFVVRGGPDGSPRARADAVEKLWTALDAVEADAFLSEAEGDKALVRQVSVAITPIDKTKGEALIELGGACPGHPDDVVAVRRKPDRAAACVARDVIGALAVTEAQLVDRHLIGAPEDQIAEVKQSGGGRTVELARKGPQWHLRSPEDRTIDAETGRVFVEALLAVEGDRFVPGLDAKAVGLDPPRATLRVISVVPNGGADGGDAERTETLEIGAEQGGVVHVRRAEDGATLEIPKERAAVLLPDDVSLRTRKVFDEPEETVRSLRIEGGGRVQRLTRDDHGAFQLVEPSGEGLVADAVMAGEVAQALSSLTVERWVGAKEPSFGLDSPRLVIEGELSSPTDGGARPKPLHVALGAPSASGSFALAGGESAVFVAPRSLEEAADRWLVDRSLTQVAPETVARVTLTGEGGKKLVVERSGEVFRVAGVPADPVSTTKAAAIRDALGELAAEAAVSIGAADKHQGFDKPKLEIVVERAGVGTSEKVPPVRLRVGAGDAFKGTSVFYVRRDGVDATFAVAQSRVRPLLDALK